MTNAEVDWQGVRRRLICDGSCGTQLAVLIETTDPEIAETLLDTHGIDALIGLSRVLKWTVIARPDRMYHFCPKCPARLYFAPVPKPEAS